MFSKNNNFLKIKRGFTIVEILVAIALFSIIILTIAYVLISSQRIYKQGEISAEIVQNGRVILERMAREIRQAKNIVTPLSEIESEALEEILFEDGHISPILEIGILQGVSQRTIILNSDSADIDDYYKDMFIKIVDGSAIGQIKKIISYDGGNKSAIIESDWEIVPFVNSGYSIDSSFYYINYYKEDNNIMRKIIAFNFSGNHIDFVPYNAIPPQGETLEIQILEEPRVIGEYVSSIKFWGLRNININMILEKQEKEIFLSTKIFGRNL